MNGVLRRTAMGVALSLLSLPALALPASAQSGPTSISGVLDICGPVISTEYGGNTAPFGQCVLAVSAFLASAGAPSAAANSQIADLVLALASLYRTDPQCTINTTELPLAIET